MLTEFIIFNLGIILDVILGLLIGRWLLHIWEKWREKHNHELAGDSPTEKGEV